MLRERIRILRASHVPRPNSLRESMRPGDLDSAGGFASNEKYELDEQYSESSSDIEFLSAARLGGRLASVDCHDPEALNHRPSLVG